MNYTYARDKFVPKRFTDGKHWFRSHGPERRMKSKRSMLGAGTEFKQRRYRFIARLRHALINDRPRTEIDLARHKRRMARNEVHKGSMRFGIANFTEALWRATPRSLAKGLAAALRKYSSALWFSKAMRIRAGKR